MPRLLDACPTHLHRAEGEFVLLESYYFICPASSRLHDLCAKSFAAGLCTDDPVTRCKHVPCALGFANNIHVISQLAILGSRS